MSVDMSMKEPLWLSAVLTREPLMKVVDEHLLEA
jgi:hypothetical protein